MRIPFVRQISWYLVVAMFLIGVAPRLDAAMAPSELIAVSQFDRAAELQQIQRVLETKVVKERLEKLGFTSEEIRAKFDALSDHQIHQLAQQIDDLRVGKDAALGVIIALVVIAVLVVVFLQLSGRKVVVTE
ncbi:MAG TPA: PA2779 family protein [Thermodesulfovibrionales bacterium]|nr:PA2779 family protein [Thermodesulfovibrionales bacterium]